MIITREMATKVRDTVAAGLVQGVGVQEPGKMCVEAAVCYALVIKFPYVGRVRPSLARARRVLLSHVGPTPLHLKQRCLVRSTKPTRGQ